MLIQDKTVFITGASSGIGAATARRLAKEKARLLLCARRHDRLAEISQTLQQEFAVEVHYFALDVRDLSQVQMQLNNLPDQWRDIDILINNAGLARGMNKLHEGNIQDWEEMIDTNLKGLLYVTRQLLPRMVGKNQGHIINIGSIAGHQTYPNGNVYCATKFAVRGLTEALRMDLNGTNIRVSLISPGMVETEFSHIRFHGDNDRAKNVYQGLQPLTGEDVADTILYAASAPAHVNINEIMIMPVAQASAMLTHRKSGNSI
jgi:3-hydroxy acid dehydrogenase/malonic semialdehyde reductase